MTGFDVVLRGGQVVDARGAARAADIAVTDGRIAQIGPVPAGSGHDEIDASGHYILPGFVDAHVHADALLLDPDVQLALLRQGVTTVIVGQDGLSFAPGPATTLRYVEDYFGAVNGRSPWPAPQGWSVADLLAGYDGASPINVGYLAPHGNLRHAACGNSTESATEAQLQQMEHLLRMALAEGALGLSTGLTYLPGAHSDTQELTRLCRVLAEQGSIHVSHMRGYDDHIEAGLTELIALAEATGVRSHASHLRGPAGLILGLIDDALGRGLGVTFDSYPYLRGSSILAAAALPQWLQADGPETALERLADPQVVERLRIEWFPPLVDTLLTHVTLAHIAAPELAWAEGRSPMEAAQEAGVDVVTFTIDVLRRSRLDVGCVYAQAVNTEDDVRVVMQHPVQMGGSDGIFIGSQPHPRGWGSFARFLGRHTRELGDWHWGEAVQHLSTLPSQVFGLGDRGSITPGAIADLAVVDPARVADIATYAQPREPAVGVPTVLVGGVVVLRDGGLTGAHPGRALRAGDEGAR